MALCSIMSRASKVQQIRYLAGFGLIDRQVTESLRDLDEPYPFFRGLVSEIGYQNTSLAFDQSLRKHGKSHYNCFDLLDLALLALTTYSKLLIRLMTIGGLILTTLSLTVGFVYTILKLMFWGWFPGDIVAYIIGILLFFAVSLLALGVVGEYVSLALRYSYRFSLVVERERVNFDTPPTDSSKPYPSGVPHHAAD